MKYDDEIYDKSIAYINRYDLNKKVSELENEIEQLTEKTIVIPFSLDEDDDICFERNGQMSYSFKSKLEELGLKVNKIKKIRIETD